MRPLQKLVKLRLLDFLHLSTGAARFITQLPLVQLDYAGNTMLKAAQLPSLIETPAAATLEQLHLRLDCPASDLNSSHFPTSVRFAQLQHLKLHCTTFGYRDDEFVDLDITQNMSLVAPTLSFCPRLQFLDLFIKHWYFDDLLKVISTQLLLQLTELKCSIAHVQTFLQLTSLYTDTVDSNLQLLTVYDTLNHTTGRRVPVERDNSEVGMHAACVKYNETRTPEQHLVKIGEYQTDYQ